MKLDPTTAHITNPKQRDYVRTTIEPFDAPPGRRWAPRLCLSGLGKPIRFEYELLANQARESALASHVFFVDTCFAKKHVPQDCWDALLTRTVCVTSWINYELKQWKDEPSINRSFRDAVVAAEQGKQSSVLHLADDFFCPDIERAIQHYIKLLCVRKELMHRVYLQLLNETGSAPSPEEVHRRVQSTVRDRGMRLVSKGSKSMDKANFAADEDLVVRAFAFALTTGRDVTILTRDGDLLEQFYKLQYLLDTHYRSHLLAESFQKQPLNFHRIEHFSKEIEMHEFESVELYSMPAGMTERVLPSEFAFVNVGVERIMESGSDLYFTSLSFAAETGMSELLRVKGETNGLNSNILGRINFHLSTRLSRQSGHGQVVALAEDRFIKENDWRASLTDVQLALVPCERLGAVQVVEQPTHHAGLATLQQASDIANFQLPQRLTPTYSLNWMSTNTEALSLAIEMMPPWTRILLSGEVIEGLSARLKKAISTKDCSVLKGSAEAAARAGLKASGIEAVCDDDGRAVVEYYISMLAHRRMFGRLCQEKLRRQSGKEPTLKQIRKEVLRYCDPSCWLRAEDYLKRQGDSNVFDDEYLVVDAVFKAICNGRETVLITRRPELVDQFWTLSSLVRSHYAAWAIAHAKAQELNSLPLQQNDPAPGFASTLVAADYLHADMLHALPEHAMQIDVQVWCIKGELDGRFQVYPVGFPVEPPMVEMLKCKNSNSFRVIDSTDGRNVYCRWTRDFDGIDSIKVFVGKDKFVEIGSDDFPADDRLAVTVKGIPAFDITLMTALDRGIPFPWAAVEQSKEAREERKRRKRQLRKKLGR